MCWSHGIQSLPWSASPRLWWALFPSLPFVYIIHSSKRLTLSSSTDQPIISVVGRCQEIKRTQILSMYTMTDIKRPDGSDPWGRIMKVCCWPRQMSANCCFWSLSLGMEGENFAESADTYWMLGTTQSHFELMGVLVPGPQMDIKITGTQVPCAKCYTDCILCTYHLPCAFNHLCVTFW